MLTRYRLLNCGVLDLGHAFTTRRLRSIPAQDKFHPLSERRKAMTDAHDDNEPVPMMQKLLDNPFLLLFLGVMIPMVVYSAWGVYDILTIPLAK
jgi:hypothetical protein